METAETDVETAERVEIEILEATTGLGIDTTTENDEAEIIGLHHHLLLPTVAGAVAVLSRTPIVMTHHLLPIRLLLLPLVLLLLVILLRLLQLVILAIVLPLVRLPLLLCPPLRRAGLRSMTLMLFMLLRPSLHLVLQFPILWDKNHMYQRSLMI